jgi:hypothetical protein
MQNGPVAFGAVTVAVPPPFRNDAGTGLDDIGGGALHAPGLAR